MTQLLVVAIAMPDSASRQVAIAAERLDETSIAIEEWRNRRQAGILMKLRMVVHDWIHAIEERRAGCPAGIRFPDRDS